MLPAPILYNLRSLLNEMGYQAPAQPTTIHANPPTEEAELPTGEELVLTEDTTTPQYIKINDGGQHGDTRIKGERTLQRHRKQQDRKVMIYQTQKDGHETAWHEEQDTK